MITKITLLETRVRSALRRRESRLPRATFRGRKSSQIVHRLPRISALYPLHALEAIEALILSTNHNALLPSCLIRCPISRIISERTRVCSPIRHSLLRLMENVYTQGDFTAFKRLSSGYFDRARQRNVISCPAIAVGYVHDVRSSAPILSCRCTQTPSIICRYRLRKL